MLLFKGYYMEFDEPASTKGKTFWRETERNRGRVREANLPTRVANHRVARNLHVLSYRASCLNLVVCRDVTLVVV